MAGTIVRTGETFPSALGPARYAIILPEDYDEPAAAERRYPVVYLLHWALTLAVFYRTLVCVSGPKRWV